MQIKVSSYVAGNSCIHCCDARVKVILLVAYSVALFMVNTWTGLCVCVALLIAGVVCSRIPSERFFSLIIPVYVLVAFTILVNGFVFDVASASLVETTSFLGNVSAGIMEQWPTVSLIGSFGFFPAGFARGCFFAVRIIALVVGSLLVTFTTTSTELTSAFSDFMSPLRTFKVPVDDIATVFSIALRFIPVTAEEFGRIYNAQLSRGASFSEGGIWRRISSWQIVMIPLFVGLFRRADSLAIAMDSRCYGLGETERTSLKDRTFTARDATVVLCGVAVFALIAVFA